MYKTHELTDHQLKVGNFLIINLLIMNLQFATTIGKDQQN